MAYRYGFELKTALMYNQLLTVTDGSRRYQGIAEFAPTKERRLLVWLDDLHIPSDQTDLVKTELRAWLSGQNILAVFKPGSRVI